MIHFLWVLEFWSGEAVREQRQRNLLASLTSSRQVAKSWQTAKALSSSHYCSGHSSILLIFSRLQYHEWKKLPATAIEGQLYKWQRGWISIWSRWGHRWPFWWWRAGEEQGEWGYLHGGVSGHCKICSEIFLEDVGSGILGDLGIGTIPVGPLVWLCCLECSYEFWELRRWDRIWWGSE